MAYLIEGENHPVVYCSNYRTASVSTAMTLLDMGAIQIGDPKKSHHAPPCNLPENTIVVQTVRNHFDVIASFYYKDKEPCDFEDYVNVILDNEHPFLDPYAFYSRFGKWDYILNYNTLQFEFDTLCLAAGLPCTQIKKARTTRSPRHRWQDLFTTSLRDKVAERYGEELEKIGYGVS